MDGHDMYMLDQGGSHVGQNKLQSSLNSAWKLNKPPWSVQASWAEPTSARVGLNWAWLDDINLISSVSLGLFLIKPNQSNLSSAIIMHYWV